MDHRFGKSAWSSNCNHLVDGAGFRMEHIHTPVRRKHSGHWLLCCCLSAYSMLHVIGCLHSVPEACNAVEMKQNLIWSKGKDRRIHAKKAGTSKILQMPSTTYLLSRCLGCFLSVWGLLELNGFNQTRADRQIPASKRANKQANKQTNRKNEK